MLLLIACIYYQCTVFALLPVTKQEQFPVLFWERFQSAVVDNTYFFKLY